MKVLLKVMMVTATIALTGYWLGHLAAHAQVAAQGAAASQYDTDLVEPVPVKASASANNAASATSSAPASASVPASASAPSDASPGARAIVQPPEGMPSGSGGPVASTSASAPGSVYPGPEELGDGMGADPANPPACEGGECGEPVPSAGDESPQAPEDYPGFYHYDGIRDTYLYEIECKVDCGVIAEHPSRFECSRVIERRFWPSGEVRSEKGTVQCVHPRFDQWAGGTTAVPGRWAGEQCLYIYDEKGRLTGRGVDCDFGAGGDGAKDSAHDAANVDEVLGGNEAGDDGSAEDHGSTESGQGSSVEGTEESVSEIGWGGFWRFGAMVLGLGGKDSEGGRPRTNPAEDGGIPMMVQMLAGVAVDRGDASESATDDQGTSVSGDSGQASHGKKATEVDPESSQLAPKEGETEAEEPFSGTTAGLVSQRLLGPAPAIRTGGTTDRPANQAVEGPEANAGVASGKGSGARGPGEGAPVSPAKFGQEVDDNDAAAARGGAKRLAANVGVGQALKPIQVLRDGSSDWRLVPCGILAICLFFWGTILLIRGRT